MNYKVTHSFADSLDDGFVYRTGDTYPRDGYEPTPDRIIELIGTANGRGFPVIEEVTEEVVEAIAEEPVTEPDTEEEIPFSEHPTAEEAEANAEEETEQAEPAAEEQTEQPKERKRTARTATKAPVKTGSRRKAK